jgi:hypothetical protein
MIGVGIDSDDKLVFLGELAFVEVVRFGFEELAELVGVVVFGGFGLSLFGNEHIVLSLYFLDWKVYKKVLNGYGPGDNIHVMHAAGP